MKLDRNILDNAGQGKYALIKLRELENYREQTTFGEIDPAVVAALDLLEKRGILDRGVVETESEFFVIRLKDRYARAALDAYAAAAFEIDPEWAEEVRTLARRAGSASPWCKDPD